MLLMGGEGGTQWRSTSHIFRSFAFFASAPVVSEPASPFIENLFTEPSRRLSKLSAQR